MPGGASAVAGVRGLGAIFTWENVKHFSFCRVFLEFFWSSVGRLLSTRDEMTVWPQRGALRGSDGHWRPRAGLELLFCPYATPN